MSFRYNVTNEGSEPVSMDGYEARMLGKTMVQSPRGSRGSGRSGVVILGLLLGTVGFLLASRQPDPQAVPTAPAVVYSVASPIKLHSPLDSVAHDFTAYESFGTPRIALQGPELLKTYQDSGRGILEGALYSFHVNGNPEALLCLERYANGTGIEITRCAGATLVFSYKDSDHFTMNAGNPSSRSYLAGYVRDGHARLW